MAEEKKEKFVIRSVRAPEEALDILKELGEREFANQGEALQYLTTLWNLEKAKQTTGREKEIEDFQHLVGRVGEMYVQSLALLSDTEERVRKDFGNQLDVQADSIAELRKQRDELKNKIKEINGILDVKESNIQQLKQERDEAVAANKATASEHSTLRESINNANAASERLRAQYDEVKARYDEVKGLGQKVDELQKDLQKAELDKDRAVLQAQKDRQQAYDALMQRYSDVVEEKKAADEANSQLLKGQEELKQEAFDTQRKLKQEADDAKRQQQQAYDELQRKYADCQHDLSMAQRQIQMLQAELKAKDE